MYLPTHSKVIRKRTPQYREKMRQKNNPVQGKDETKEHPSTGKR
jgi:hypothetical protein